MPAVIPAEMRVAWLQDKEGVVEQSDLIFRVRSLREKPVKKGVGLPVVCPSEGPAGKESGINCATCSRCWK